MLAIRKPSPTAPPRFLLSGDTIDASTRACARPHPWARIAGRVAAHVALISLTGCAIHYHDAKTDTEHVWGLAHVKMRAASVTSDAASAAPSATLSAPAPAPTSAPAIASQVETFGLGLHFGAGTPGSDSGLNLGWDRRTRVFVPDDTALSLEWPTPTSGLFDVRIGAEPPVLAPATVPAPSPSP